MHKRSRILLVGLVCFLAHACRAGAESFSEAPEWGAYFREAQTQGTFVLYDLRHDRWKAYNLPRAETRFIPASTFKIPHALIALETKVVQDPRQVFPWDGVVRGYPDWNRDQTLRTAMKYSVVPVFQGFARVIGPERMKEYLAKFRYGNMDISGEIDRFWLDGGPLAVSAVEEVRFLVGLYKDALPVSRESQWIVKDILVNEAAKEYVLRAKTGMASGIGWWVGWVETDDNAYFFACNLDLAQQRNAGDRIGISRKILASEKILPLKEKE